MVRSLRILALLLVPLAIAATSARAEEPKVGDYYKDTSDLGFRVKVPHGWQVIPPQGDDVNTIVKYDPPVSKFVPMGPDPHYQLDIHAFLIRFDHRKKPEDPTAKPGVHRVEHNCKDVQDWAKTYWQWGGHLKLESQKDFVANKITATSYDYVGLLNPGDPKTAIHFYAAVYKLMPDCEVALAFIGPGDKRWMKWQAPVDQMAKSFASRETKEGPAGATEGESLRDKTRAECTKKLATLGDVSKWRLVESPHYFIMTADPDKGFIDELKMRLEAIHEIYTLDYPAAKAEEYRKIGAANKTGDHRDAKPDEPEPEPPSAADSQELASCSVVRVLTDEASYHSYGGPPQSAGYWSPSLRELVVYDGKMVGGKADTWAVINHEAFHQYIFYFYGSIAPQSWYNEGTGDFYAGFQLRTGKFSLERFKWRNDTIKESIQAGKIVPLKELVRFTQQEYYGQNKYELDGGHNYAQGWSLIYFLRTGKAHKAKGWDVRWDSILETYLRVLATSGKVDQAVDEAFKDVDFDALQQSWADYISH